MNDYNPLTDPHYMSEDMKAYFKDQLMRLHEEVLEREKSALQAIQEDQSREPDPVDQGTMEELQYNNEMFGLAEHDLRLEVEAAINRLEEGIYGYCQETSIPIGVERLMAVPYARYGLESQKSKEAKEDHHTH